MVSRATSCRPKWTCRRRSSAVLPVFGKAGDNQIEDVLLVPELVRRAELQVVRVLRW